jgi:TPP-dependent pyruvate/acetoin dehydrogenase alpha subunit
MHLYSMQHGLLGTNGIVGPSIINGAGAGFTARYTGTDQVAVAFFGDGAVNTGSFHEGLNLAAIWDLPVVFVCENNLYATEMPFLNATAGQSVAKRAAAYDMPGVELDGQDVLQIYDAAGEAIQRARSGGGPTLIECRTYRYVGHHEGDPGTGYRTLEEVEQWKQHDPLQKLHSVLTSEGVHQETFDSIEDEIGEVVEDAVSYSDQSPWPEPEDAFTQIFASPF